MKTSEAEFSRALWTIMSLFQLKSDLGQFSIKTDLI